VQVESRICGIYTEVLDDDQNISPKRLSGYLTILKKLRVVLRKHRVHSSPGVVSEAERVSALVEEVINWILMIVPASYAASESEAISSTSYNIGKSFFQHSLP
jgi:hypothetical protein